MPIQMGRNAFHLIAWLDQNLGTGRYLLALTRRIFVLIYPHVIRLSEISVSCQYVEWHHVKQLTALIGG
jgi:hypothetical protein